MYIKTLLFGYDLQNITAVMDYVKKNYNGISNLDNIPEEEWHDYYMWIGRGDDVMNALDILSDQLNNDPQFIELVKRCKGVRVRKKRD